MTNLTSEIRGSLILAAYHQNTTILKSMSVIRKKKKKKKEVELPVILGDEPYIHILQLLLILGLFPLTKKMHLG